MNRPSQTLLAPLLAVLAMLLALTGNASAAFNYAVTEPHYGNFSLWETEASRVFGYEEAHPTREIGEWIYDDASGVPVYVRQNPWTMFDPHGLKSARKNHGETRLMWYRYTGKDKKGKKQFKLSKVDPSKVKGAVNIFINGIMNDEQNAAGNAMDKMGTKSGFMIYNPTESFLKDSWQTLVGKSSKGSRAAAQTTMILAQMKNIDHGKSTIHAHSQGTVIATNAIRMLSEASPAWKKQMRGMKAKLWGPAVNKPIARRILRKSGAVFNPKTDWHANKADPVTQVIGMNAITDGRPWRFAMGVAAAPYMTSSEHSPHSNKNGATKGWTKGLKME